MHLSNTSLCCKLECHSIYFQWTIIASLLDIALSDKQEYVDYFMSDFGWILSAGVFFRKDLLEYLLLMINDGPSAV